MFQDVLKKTHEVPETVAAELKGHPSVDNRNHPFLTNQSFVPAGFWSISSPINRTSASIRLICLEVSFCSILCCDHDSRVSGCWSSSCFFRLLSSSTRLCTAKLLQSSSGSPSATSVNRNTLTRSFAANVQHVGINVCTIYQVWKLSSVCSVYSKVKLLLSSRE